LIEGGSSILSPKLCERCNKPAVIMTQDQHILSNPSYRDGFLCNVCKLVKKYTVGFVSKRVTLKPNEARDLISKVTKMRQVKRASSEGKSNEPKHNFPTFGSSDIAGITKFLGLPEEEEDNTLVWHCKSCKFDACLKCWPRKEDTAIDVAFRKGNFLLACFLLNKIEDSSYHQTCDQFWSLARPSIELSKKTILDMLFEVGRSYLSDKVTNRLKTYPHLFVDVLAEAKRRCIKEFPTKYPHYRPQTIPSVAQLFQHLFGLTNRCHFNGNHGTSVWFRGVSAQFLKRIQMMIEDKRMSTLEVKDKIILNEVAKCEGTLMFDKCPEDQRGPCTIFISHAWKNRYYDLVDVLKTSYPKACFFNDIISIEQTSKRHSELMQDLKALPDVIKYSGHTVLVSDMQLFPITRIWVLFELYHTLVIADVPLSVQFTEEGLESKDGDVFEIQDEIEKRISCLDVLKANASVEADRKRILQLIEETVPGGCEQFNHQLRAALKHEWSANIREKWGWIMLKNVRRELKKIPILEKEVSDLKAKVAELFDAKIK